MLRRQANELPGAPSQEEAVIAFGKFKLNLGTREMFREDEPMPHPGGAAPPGERAAGRAVAGRGGYRLW
ncbi:hypothetical protein CKQ90_34645 [Klebsiella pneumoniae]|nr:hypothetical protein CKQ90_34645 [Klebsiella pneumoniae]